MEAAIGSASYGQNSSMTAAGETPSGSLAVFDLELHK